MRTKGQSAVKPADIRPRRDKKNRKISPRRLLYERSDVQPRWITKDAMTIPINRRIY